MPTGVPVVASRDAYSIRPLCEMYGLALGQMGLHKHSLLMSQPVCYLIEGIWKQWVHAEETTVR